MAAFLSVATDGDRRGAVIVLKNARLIDGTGKSAVNAANVVLDGNKISAITTTNQADFPGDAEIVNCAGLT
ncbi:MAG TPA: hypothetical protein VN900_04865, partial [Stellaceae bacterium]|nr:hypothetical protein [Stellaceae bacterium]